MEPSEKSTDEQKEIPTRGNPEPGRFEGRQVKTPIESVDSALFHVPPRKANEYMKILNDYTFREMQELEKLVTDHEDAKGLAIIVSHSGSKEKPLKGVEDDRRSAVEAFTHLQFAIKELKDQPTRQVATVIRAVSSYPFPESYKRIIFVYAGHGDSENITDGKDDKLHIMNAIVDPLSNINFAPQLAKIVKLYFFDCCRGSKEDSGIYKASGEEYGDSWKLRAVPTCGNYLMAFSTMRGMVAFDLGSNWTKYLMEELKTNTASINDILTKVTFKVIEHLEGQKHLQQTYVVSTLRERVCLFEEIKRTT